MIKHKLPACTGTERFRIDLLVSSQSFVDHVAGRRGGGAGHDGSYEAAASVTSVVAAAARTERRG